MDSDPSKKTKIEEEVPSVDPNAPLKVEEKAVSNEVPPSDVNAPLQIEKITKDESVPESNLNAPLKVEDSVQAHDDSAQEKSSKKLFIFGSVAVGVIILAIGGFIAIQLRNNASQEKEVLVEIKPIEEKKEEVKEEIVRSDYSFEVLNGSGITGAAKKIADKLTELGYVVVKTGNADNSDYEETQLFIAEDLESKQELLLADLEAELNISSVSGKLKDSTPSARIIIGKDIE